MMMITPNSRARKGGAEGGVEIVVWKNLRGEKECRLWGNGVIYSLNWEHVMSNEF